MLFLPCLILSLVLRQAISYYLSVHVACRQRQAVLSDVQLSPAATTIKQQQQTTDSTAAAALAGKSLHDFTGPSVTRFEGSVSAAHRRNCR